MEEDRCARLSEEEIEIISPPVADPCDMLEGALVTLTKEIAKLDPDLVAHGFLGGEFGYGAHYENDVFLMHPFCWCELDDCPWCGGCKCPDPAPKHYVDGAEVSANAAWEFSRNLLGKLPHEVAKYGTPKYLAYDKLWNERIKERDRRSKTIYQARTHTCEPCGMMADRQEDESWKPSQSAPNFWHKKSGLKVWWYKWIGRDTEAIGADGADIGAIFNECLSSLTPRAAMEGGISNRSLFEFNHDYWWKIESTRAEFGEALQQFLASASLKNADALERFGIRWFGTRHHSDAFETNFGGVKTAEKESAK